MADVIRDDPNTTAGTAQEPQNDTNTADTSAKQPTVEELMAQLAQAKAENAKLQNKANKASSDAAEWKKQFRAKQTADEQEAEAKKEAEERQAAEHAELVDFKNRTLAKERYIMQGMTADLAAKAAEAEISQDMDLLASIQKQHTEALLKAARADWVKDQHPINAGTGDGESGITQKQFDRMGYQQRVEFKKNHPNEYKRFSQK